LGLALLKQGDSNGALAELKKVLEQNPGDREASDLVDRLQAQGPASGLVKPSLFRLKTNFNETAYRQLKAMIQNMR
jgi:hypothetical protein